MLQLQQQKQSTTLPHQLQQLEQRITYTDDKINEKVYRLYGLSEEEVRLVEGRRRITRAYLKIMARQFNDS